MIIALHDCFCVLAIERTGCLLVCYGNHGQLTWSLTLPQQEYSECINLVGTYICVCKAGYYKAMNESGSCEACPAGTYMNMTGGTACLVCPADTPFSAPGAAGCLEDDLFRQCFSQTFSLEGMQRVS